jgi:hypothetical protein
MPPLQNTRHELFAQAIARGDPAYRAYGDLYGAESHAAEANGSRLMKNDRVATRIGELKARTAVRTEKTAASLVKDLDDAIEFAKACKNPSAVVRAIVAQARLLGLVVDRSEVSVQHRPAPWPTKTIELSEAEWVAQFSTGPGPRPALTDQGKRLEAEKRKLNGNTRPEPIGEDRSESWRPAAGSLMAIPSDERECQAEIHKREGGLSLYATSSALSRCHVAASLVVKNLPIKYTAARRHAPPINPILSPLTPRQGIMTLPVVFFKAYGWGIRHGWEPWSCRSEISRVGALRRR